MGLITKDPDTEEKVEVPDKPVPDGFKVIHDDEAGPESAGRQPLLLDGTRVKFTDENGTTRMGVIIRTEFASSEASVQFHNPHGQGRMFAEVGHYIVRTRDARNETFEVKPSNLSELDVTQGWARGES